MYKTVPLAVLPVSTKTSTVLDKFSNFAHSETAGLTIAVVDDDLPTRMVLRKVLAKQGYTVVEAANGQLAIDLVRSSRVDLVLMDVMMPEVDGYGACAQIRLMMGDDSLPIIMLTAADDIESIEMAFNAGATDFITKPINWPLLTERVRYALRAGALNREVRRSRLRESAVRRVAGLGYWEWNLELGSLGWSEELELLTGVAAHRLASLASLSEHVHPDDRRRLLAVLERSRDTGAKVDVEFRLQTARQEYIIRLIGERGTQGGEANQLYGVFQDVSGTRRAEALVDYLAMHDETTGLGNRRLFVSQVRGRLDELRQQPGKVLLVGTIDITRFGRYNDTYGETGANALLALIAQRLSESVAGAGFEVARIGGDEFAIMLTDVDEPAVEQRFKAVTDKLGAPFRLEHQEVFLSHSAGYTLFPEHAADAEGLLKLAQDAQRQARRLGHECLRSSTDPDEAAHQRAQLELERDLHKALERGEFFLVFQPQMAFGSSKIGGAEALIRWRHPELGVVPPVQFVPLLEETGLIHEVGTWVLQEACRQAAAWAREGLNLRVGVNLSPRQFMADDLLDVVTQASLAAGVAPHLIELEITESLTMQDVQRSIVLLERLRSLGFKIALDDFGVGYSSMEYLLKFPVDVIKIDRAFVTHITRSRSDRAIVRAMAVLAQDLGMSVIAEGVETQRQCDFIEAVGVDEVQGYLVGRPMSPEELADLARHFTRNH